MTGRLDGKVIIIAGAASRGEGVGTGKAMAVLSAREGAKVVLVNRTPERAELLREEILSEGGDAMVFTGDVSQEEDAHAMVAAADLFKSPHEYCVTTTTTRMPHPQTDRL